MQLDPTGQTDRTGEIIVRDARFYRLVTLKGSLGAAEAYRLGYWESPDLTALMQVFARNLDSAKQMGSRLKSLMNFGSRLRHQLNKNSRHGSRKNISAHYDLSNAFYSLFLDDTLTYSSGYFPTAESSLREASIEKYDRICRELSLTADDNILEIGTGWGGFAEHAAKNYGCRVTTTTISKEQHAFAQQRFLNQAITDKVTLLQKDYRDLNGQFDKLVSIEMIEAVGHEYLDDFFSKCSSLLKPDGAMALQAITIPDQRYERYLRSVDFIQEYIFPGGCLPSLGAMTKSVASVTDLRLSHMDDFAQHYAQTLKCWRSRFFENIDAIRNLGMDSPFIRLWEYYLCYCEAAFRENTIGVCQLIYQKPHSSLPMQSRAS